MGVFFIGIKAMRETTWYQNRATDYLSLRMGLGYLGATLFMVMRLGKSWSVIRFAEKYKDRFKKVLVLGPAKPIHSWVGELDLAGIESYPLTGTGKKKKIDKIPEQGFILSSYKTAMLYDLLSLDWDMVVFDESFLFAKPGTKRSHYLLEARKKNRWFAVGLSGNPEAESALDLVMQYMVVDGNLGPYTSPYEFLEVNTYVDSFGKPKLFPGQEDLIHNYMRENSFCLTREQARVGGPKEYGKIICELPEEWRIQYNAAMKEEKLIRHGKLQRICSAVTSKEDAEEGECLSEFKMDAVMESGLLQDRAVFFVKYLSEGRMAAHRLGTEFLHGGTSEKKLTDTMKKWRSGEIKYIVLQETAFKMGQNFSEANQIIGLSNTCSGDDRTQFEDRCIHLEKKDPVLILDVVCRFGIDGYIAEMVKDKRHTSQSILQECAGRVKEIDPWQES